jgi:hypothetical protein
MLRRVNSTRSWIATDPMPKSKQTIRIAILCFIMVFVSESVASAGVDIGGAICVQEISPGQHVTHRITVLTDKDSLPVDIEAKIKGWTQGLKDELLAIEPSEDQSYFTAAPFLKVTPKRLHAEPGVLQEILLEGDVPDDAGPGVLLAVVQIKTLPVENKSMIKVVTAVNVPVKLIVNKDKIIRTGEFTAFNIIGPGPRRDNNITVSLMLNNTGNANYYPIVKAALKDESGNILETKSIEASNTLLPTHARLLNLTLGPEETLIGTYYVNVTTSTEDGIVLASKEISFKV